jgi:hypothetical protein
MQPMTSASSHHALRRPRHIGFTIRDQSPWNIIQDNRWRDFRTIIFYILILSDWVLHVWTFKKKLRYLNGIFFFLLAPIYHTFPRNITFNYIIQTDPNITDCWHKNYKNKSVKNILYKVLNTIKFTQGNLRCILSNFRDTQFYYSIWRRQQTTYTVLFNYCLGFWRNL